MKLGVERPGQSVIYLKRDILFFANVTKKAKYPKLLNVNLNY